MSSAGTKPLVTIDSAYSFHAGEAFASYNQFLTKLEQHSANDLVYYWRRDSRTIQGSAAKTSRPLAQAIRYSYVRLACIFGGQRYESKSTGARRKSTTLRKDCPAFICLRASKCGQQLVVMEVSNEHNHEVTKEANRTLAHRKKLSSDLKDEVKDFLLSGVDRNLIIEYVHIKAGKVLTSKDICNLAAAAKREKPLREVHEWEKALMEAVIRSDIWEKVLNRTDACLKKADQEFSSNDTPEERNKKLPDYLKEEIKDLLLYGVDQNLIIEYFREKDGEVLNSEDIGILAAAAKENEPLEDRKIYMMKKGLYEAAIREYIQEKVQDSTYASRKKDNQRESLESNVDSSDMPEERLEEDFDELEEVKEKPEIVPEEGIESVPGEQPANRPSKRRFRWRSNRCCASLLNNRLARAQLKVLHAKKQKIIEETKLLKLEKQKLQMEIEAMKEVKCGR